MEQVIRDNTSNMRGFNSLMALSLFEKGEQYEAKGYALDVVATNMYITTKN